MFWSKALNLLSCILCVCGNALETKVELGLLMDPTLHRFQMSK